MTLDLLKPLLQSNINLLSAAAIDSLPAIVYSAPTPFIDLMRLNYCHLHFDYLFTLSSISFSISFPPFRHIIHTFYLNPLPTSMRKRRPPSQMTRTMIWTSRASMRRISGPTRSWRPPEDCRHLWRITRQSLSASPWRIWTSITTTRR